MSSASDLLAAALRLGCGVRQLPADALPTVPCVFFANHSSHLDFATLWAALPPAQRRRVRPVAGRDYWEKGPLRRWLAGRVFRAVLIERQKVTVATNPLTPMVDALDAGASLIVFPEGTRSPDGQIQPFKSGLHHLARARPTTPLVPIFLDNLNRILPKGDFLPVPLVATLAVGAPLAFDPAEAKTDFLVRAQLALVGATLGSIRMVTGAALPGPNALVAFTATEKLPLSVGVPTIWPEPLTDRPAGRPVAPYASMGGLVALIWMAVIGPLPIRPVAVGAATRGALTVGREVGTMLKVTAKGAPVPAAFVATKDVTTWPLVVGVPVITPLVAPSARPVGNALPLATAKFRMGRLVAVRVNAPVYTWLAFVVTVLDALLIVGTWFGLMRMVTGAALPVPITLVARATTTKSPLSSGVPTICPEPLTVKPFGRPVAL
jgi:1-acyl-sn-glycerol-3-phosphate acyltransferase